MKISIEDNEVEGMYETFYEIVKQQLDVYIRIERDGVYQVFNRDSCLLEKTIYSNG